MENKWVIIMASHRSNGYSAYFSKVLQKTLFDEGAKPLLYDINALNVNPCIDCDVCRTHYATCFHNDDMTGFYEVLKHATHLVFVTPVYFAGVTSKLKTLVDRLQMVFMCDFSFKKPFVNEGIKKGYVVSFGGARTYPQQFLGTQLTLDLVFRNFKMAREAFVEYPGTDHWTEEHLETIIKEEAIGYAKLWIRGDDNEK